MHDQALLDHLTTIGALKEGHFLLSSRRHSDRYLEKFDLFRRPRETETVCRAFADRYRDAGIDVVVGPTTGGILLAFETARQLGAAAAYAERRADGASGREFRRGTTFRSGDRVLVLDDVLTTGGSIRETLDALRSQSVEVIGVGVLVDRSGGRAAFGVPLASLAAMDVATWDAADCPLCRDRMPLVKPGTTAASV